MEVFILMNTKKGFRRYFRSVVSITAAASMVLSGAFASYTATVKADLLYMRQTPGGEIIGGLPNGTEVNVLDSSNSDWFKISVNGKEGYVSSQYLSKPASVDNTVPATESAATATPPIAVTTQSSTDTTESTSAVTTESVAGSVGRITCSTSVNLREQPNTDSKILSEIINGTVVVVTGKNGDWYGVSYNGKAGYVHPDYIRVVDKSGLSSINGKAVGATSIVKPSANAVSFTGSSSKRNEVLNFAAKFIGTPYSYGGSTPNGFDCSGFVYYVFNNTVGTLPRIAQSQFDATTRVSRDELIPGDLVFFGSSSYSISHVGIYTGQNADGEDEFIHSPHTGDVVKYDTLSGSYGGRFQGGGRVIFD